LRIPVRPGTACIPHRGKRRPAVGRSSRINCCPAHDFWARSTPTAYHPIASRGSPSEYPSAASIDCLLAASARSPSRYRDALFVPDTTDNGFVSHVALTSRRFAGVDSMIAAIAMSGSLPRAITAPRGRSTPASTVQRVWPGLVLPCPVPFGVVATFQWNDERQSVVEDNSTMISFFDDQSDDLLAGLD